MRAALERGDWDEVGRQIAAEWENRKRLAPGVTTPAIDDLIARAAGGRRDGGQGLRRRRRRLPVLLRPARPRGRRSPRRSPPAARACSTSTSRRKASGLDNAGHRADPRRDRRSARDQGREPVQDSRVPQRRRHRRPTIRTTWRRSTRTALREIPGIGKDLAARIREIADDRRLRSTTASCSPSFPPTILDLLHLQGVGPKTVAMLYRELGIRTLDDLRARGARRPHPRAQGHGREEGSADPQGARGAEAPRGPAPAAGTRTRPPTALVAYLRERVPPRPITPVGSLRRGCETCGDIDILAAGADPSLMDVFVAHPLVERVLGTRRHEVERAAARRLPGRPAARAGRQPRRRAAVLHRLEGAQHRAARPRDRARVQAERVRPLPHRRRRARRRRDGGGDLRGARPGLDPAGTARGPRRDRGRRTARRCPA